MYVLILKEMIESIQRFSYRFENNSIRVSKYKLCIERLSVNDNAEISFDISSIWAFYTIILII